MKITSRILIFLAIGKRLSELILNPNLYREIQNWPLFLLIYLVPQKRKITLNLRQGAKLTLRGETNDKWPVSEIIVRDVYRLRKLTPAPNIIIDLGAGIGDFSIIAGVLFPQAIIYAYEPDAGAFNMLIQNIEANSLLNRVHAVKKAVSRKNSKLPMSIQQTKGYPSLMNRFPPSKILETTSLDQVMVQFQINTLDLLKIDIEGAEYAVLYSQPISIFKKIRRIHLECHNFDEKKFSSRYLTQFLEKMGFDTEKSTSFDPTICVIFALNRKYI